MKAGWEAFALALLTLTCATLTAQQSAGYSQPYLTSMKRSYPEGIRVHELSRPVQEAIRPVLENASYRATGPVENINADPRLYHWLLEHPEKATEIWKKLGAKCMPIHPRGPGRYGYTDENGTDVSWVSIVRSRHLRVWYAEGMVKVATLLPRITIKALLILYIQEEQGKDGKTRIKHQSKLLLQTESRAMRLVAKIVGASAPKMADAYMKQIQFFFGALAEYLTENPHRMQKLLK